MLDGCETIRLALQSDTYPYVVPLSFGWEEKDERVYLYVHGAREGLRHDLRARDHRVCVEADRFLGYARTSSSVSSRCVTCSAAVMPCCNSMPRPSITWS